MTHRYAFLRAAFLSGCLALVPLPGLADEGRSGVASVVTGTLEASKGAALPEKLDLRACFSSVREKGRRDECGKEETVECNLQGTVFQCPIDPGLQDLRLAAPGYAPFYFWTFQAEPGAVHSLGTLRLRSGASFSGWLKPAARIEPGSKPRVFAQRFLLGRVDNESETKRAEALTFEGRIDQRLFFQFAGLPAGAWIIRAEAPGFATVRVGPFSLGEGEEKAIEQPVELYPPVTFSVYLDPAVDWNGRPWKVLLKKSASFSNVEDVVAEEEAGFQGKAELSHLEPGGYELEILDADASSWLQQLVEVRPEMPPIFYDLPVVRVAGELRVGASGKKGSVVFGAYRRPRISVATDEEGRFQAMLPRAGKWEILVEHSGLEVRVADVEVASRGEKNLRIRLPDTALRGQVLQEGEPVPGASVVLRSGIENPKPLGSALTDADGRFELLGLQEGSVRAAAVLGKSASDWTSIELREKAPVEIELHLAKTHSVVGQVSAAGSPVPGAAVIAIFGDTGPFPSAQQSMSGADGSVSFELPVKLGIFDLIIFAPGRGVTWKRRAVPPPGSRFEVSLPAATGQMKVTVPPETFDDWFLARGESVLPFRVVYRWLAEAGRVQQVIGSLAFKLSEVEVGQYQLCRLAGAALTDCVEGEVLPGATLELIGSARLPEP